MNDPQGVAMALLIDVHSLDSPVSLDDVATAHAADVQIQGPHRMM